MERGERIELSPSAWQTGVLPLYEPRKNTPLHRQLLDGHPGLRTAGRNPGERF